MQVTNTNNQLRIVSSSNTQFYKYEGISNVTWVQSNGVYSVLITYEDDYFVKIPLAQVTNQVTWTDNVAGANNAVITISGWIDASTAALATEATLSNIDTNVADILSNTDGVLRAPNLLRTTTSGNLSSVATEIYSVSVSNVGLSNGVLLGSTIKPGETVNFDAGSLNHYFNSFAYDATGTEFIIIYIS